MILEDFLQRIVVIDPVRFRPLDGDGVEVVGETALRDRLAVDDGDDAVDRQAGADVRPVESLYERFRQRKAGRFNDDVFGGAFKREQRFDRGREIVRDGATEAAVGEFDDVFCGTILDAAGAQDFSINADIAELIDHERKATVARVLDHMPDQRCLAGAKKAGDDGRGNFCGEFFSGAHGLVSAGWR